MPLAHRATQPLQLNGNLIGAPIMCHTAVWFWAAREAQTPATAKSVNATFMNVAGLPPQPATGALVAYANWDLANGTAGLPAGTVLYWPEGGTHVAVVTATGDIASYNQVAQFNVPNNDRGHSIVSAAQVIPARSQCVFISEAQIVREAARRNL